MSKSVGGVAVTGDIWAVSLESDADYREASLELASQVGVPGRVTDPETLTATLASIMRGLGTASLGLV